jgi:23S rRNA (uridine2552-2'-O)-methyltransferase
MPNPRKPDRFQQMARDEGYEARSVYKLREIDDRLRVIPRKGAVLDLGCAPGSWSRFVRERGGPSVTIVGIDLQPVRAYVGEFIEGSILETPASLLRERLGGNARLVLSDMAPATTGNKSADHLRQMELARMARQVATEVLAFEGAFVAKVFDGVEVPDFASELKPWFREVKRMRPEAVRRESREFFVVGLGFRRPATTPSIDGPAPAPYTPVVRTSHNADSGDVD